MLAIMAAFLLATGDDPAQDLNRMQGVWSAVLWESGGARKAGGDIKIRYEFKSFDVTHLDGDGGSFVMRVTNIDPTAKPHPIIDFTRGEGEKSQTIHGIYKLEGDTLTICTSRLPAGRPTDFATEPDDRRLLRVFKREKALP